MNSQEEKTLRQVEAGETLHDRLSPVKPAAPPVVAAQTSRLAFLQSLAGHVPAVVWATDGELRILSNQGSGLTRLGLQPGELVGQTLYSYLQTRDPESPPIAAHLRALRAEAVQVQVDWQGHAYQAFVEPLRGSQGEVAGCLGVALDLTQCQRNEQSLGALACKEERLRQAQKLEAVGRLTVGIVHDLNNLLTPILGYSDMLLPRFPPGDMVREGLEQIKKAGERVASLAHQLLDFSRKRPVQPCPVDLNAAVADMARLLRRLLGEEIELVTVPGAGLWPVLGDAGQLDQIILNLASNARDAMRQGGRLTIETRNRNLDEAHIRTHPRGRSGPHVMLAVSDTGCGMDETTRSRLFEPFFSTKGEYGTGLGLVTVDEIVRESGGHLEVDSEPSVGTTFRVYLPRAEGEIEPARAEVLATPTCRATVLLVEDEADVRAVTRQMLTACGCVVLEAGNGEAALSLARCYAGRIDLLATDVVLPKLSGREVAQQLALQRPRLRVLYFSGHAEDTVTQHGVLSGGAAFLQKPFTPATLACKVRELLDAIPG